MNLLTLEDLTISYSDNNLLDHISFYMDEGEKVGVIGVNGTGKSTLLRIIAGLEQADEGRYTLANNKVIKFLPQAPQFDDEQSIIEYILSDLRSDEDYGMWQAQAKSMLAELGILNTDDNVKILSGGQRKKVAIVKALLSDADLLILDEPTNHLDSEVTQWLEDYLRGYKGAVLMVTHDRYFLDSVVNRIV